MRNLIREELEVCTDLIHPFDYSIFFTGSDLERAHAIADGTNFMSGPLQSERKENYLKEALLLKQAYSLCKSLASEHEQLEAAFFESISCEAQKSSIRPILFPLLNEN